MSHIQLRPATVADCSAVYELICTLEAKRFPPDAFAALFQRNLADPRWRYWLAVQARAVLGLISLHVQDLLHHCGPVGEIQEFVVDPRRRGQGIGRLLLGVVKDDAVRQRLLGLEVTTSKRRVENVAVYERLGFGLSHNKFTIALSPDY